MWQCVHGTNHYKTNITKCIHHWTLKGCEMSDLRKLHLSEAPKVILKEWCNIPLYTKFIYIRRTRWTKAVLKAEDYYSIINLLSGLFIFLTLCNFPHKQYINQTHMLYVSICAFQTFLQIIINSFITLNEQKLHWHSMCPGVARMKACICARA